MENRPPVVTTYLQTPIGWLRVRGSERGILAVAFVEEDPKDVEEHDCLRDCLEQLQEYFAEGESTFHSLPLLVQATDFQDKVYEALWDIPYGQTQTYEDVAKYIGHPKASRAVGTALGRNALSIILPCHRVVPKSGKTGEYAWGAWRKEWLLAHEKS